MTLYEDLTDTVAAATPEGTMAERMWAATRKRPVLWAASGTNEEVMTDAQPKEDDIAGHRNFVVLGVEKGTATTWPTVRSAIDCNGAMCRGGG